MINDIVEQVWMAFKFEEMDDFTKQEMFRMFQEIMPGNYVIEYDPDPTLQRWWIRFVFEDPEEELIWWLKWS